MKIIFDFATVQANILDTVNLSNIAKELLSRHEQFKTRAERSFTLPLPAQSITLYGVFHQNEEESELDEVIVSTISNRLDSDFADMQ